MADLDTVLALGGALEDATLALCFIGQNPHISLVIPSMYDVKEIEQNIAACENMSELSAEEQMRISKIRDELGTQFCRRCNYCQPCSAGINISGAFLFESYLKRYGLAQWARSRYMAMEKKTGGCIECGICEERCPYHLPIHEKLARCWDAFGESMAG